MKHTDPYKDDIGMQIAKAEREGDILFLDKMVKEGKLNLLRVSPDEQWNCLHKANIWTPSPKETIRFYLEKGVEVNAQDCYGMTPLHYAMRAQNAEAALLLLEAGADPNIPNRDNTIPLAMIGGMPERLDILELMLKKGGNVHHFNGHETVLDSYLPGVDEDYLTPVYELMQKYA